MRRSWLAWAAAWLQSTSGAVAQSPPRGGGDIAPPLAPAVLAVPYLPQSTLLCGGAALAMVERWWGRRGVFAEDFAALVRPELGGIRTTDLALAAEHRGWDTRLVAGTAEAVRTKIEAGVPVIALIEVARDRYHFVVVLSWSAGRVVYHDPADAPNRALDQAQFLSRWDGARRWAMAVRPGAAVAPPPSPRPDSQPAAAMPCAPWVDRALDAAVAGRLDEAVRLLEEAERACPTEPIVTRELAGVRFRQKRYAEVVPLAEKYLTRAPDDSLAWQLLGTSRFVSGDRAAALEAWNRIGKPVTDIVRIDGTRDVRYRVLSDQIGTAPGEPLTPASLELARRRLSDVPALRRSVVGYEPVPGGMAELRVAVDERPVIEPLWRLLLANAVRAVANREVEAMVSSPFRLGETFGAQWRWEEARPRVFVGAALPAVIGIPGVIRIGENWDQFRFADALGNAVEEESRRARHIGFGGWVTAGIRPSVTLTYDSWSADRNYLGISANMDAYARDDRLRVRVGATQAAGLSGTGAHTQLEARARWASATTIARPSWSARAGVNWASQGTPQGAWPIAGTNLEWAIPLRAHSATERGLLDPSSTGRRIAHGGLTADYPLHRFGVLVLAAGAFLDGARIDHRADGSTGNRWLFDAGGGLRLGVGDGKLGVFRVDVARGLTDGKTAVTIGVQREWPY
jgi:tetratricopeptide (TPR) repeat protein